MIMRSKYTFHGTTLDEKVDVALSWNYCNALVKYILPEAEQTQNTSNPCFAERADPAKLAVKAGAPCTQICSGGMDA